MASVEKAHWAYAPRLSKRAPLMGKLRRRVPQKLTYLIATVAFLLFIYLTRRPSSPSPSTSPASGTGSQQRNKLANSFPSAPSPEDLPCRNLPGADDVLVILKTGSTEVKDKLPIHLHTTLRCYPHYMLFSDYEESFADEHIYDALEYVAPKIKEEHPDFELWRRLRDGGRGGLQSHELSGPISKPQGMHGKPSNPGWKLDKWKFLPMVNRTLNAHPDKKWYVFVETDSYVLWQSLLNYLNALDWRKPYYMGAQTWIGDVEFAHGGCGFAASRTAMEQVVAMFNDKQAEWESYTMGHWAGDCVLGKAFKDVGISLHQAWPIWQGDDIGAMTYGRREGPQRMWCSPTVSYHHLAPSVVEELWDFEQDWISRTNGDSSLFLRHKDMYSQYILPRIAKPRYNWDNHANQDRGFVSSLTECREICEGERVCLQYAVSPEMRCLTTDTPNLGESANGVQSGWVFERMKQWSDEAEPCGEGDSWIT